MVMPYKKFLFNKIHNGIYYHNMEDRYLLLVDTVELNRDGFSCRELSGVGDSRRALAMFGYTS